MADTSWWSGEARYKLVAQYHLKGQAVSVWNPLQPEKGGTSIQLAIRQDAQALGVDWLLRPDVAA